MIYNKHVSNLQKYLEIIRVRIAEPCQPQLPLLCQFSSVIGTLSSVDSELVVPDFSRTVKRKVVTVIIAADGLDRLHAYHLRRERAVKKTVEHLKANRKGVKKIKAADVHISSVADYAVTSFDTVGVLINTPAWKTTPCHRHRLVRTCLAMPQLSD